ncbi:hypothetical protein LCGC14_1260910 [marine sediment metagenome]|uniref:Uncharacterized protein n=1 Tax=marine sediment metagenome TaxID=412755 RepID=A0A0F9L361_9ZZZZ
MDDEYYDTSTRELAAGVLRQAVSDQEVEFETLELWCELVDLDPALFQEKLRGIILLDK